MPRLRMGQHMGEWGRGDIVAHGRDVAKGAAGVVCLCGQGAS